MPANANANATRPRLLYVSDLGYPAKGRRYCDEDIDLSARLGADFDVALCHPSAAVGLMDRFDVVVVRNSGPVIHDTPCSAATDAGTRGPARGRAPRIR